MSKITIINPQKPKTAAKIVKSQLREDLCQLRFVKDDGSKRVMLGTLNPTFLPPPKKGKKADKAPGPVQQVVVWDVEAQAFRSFRIERLLSIKTVG